MNIHNGVDSCEVLGKGNEGRARGHVLSPGRLFFFNLDYLLM
jgi:hypothetical protein